MYKNDRVIASGREPGLEVTSKLFRAWQVARRGRIPAEDMTTQFGSGLSEDALTPITPMNDSSLD